MCVRQEPRCGDFGSFPPDLMRPSMYSCNRRSFSEGRRSGISRSDQQSDQIRAFAANFDRPLRVTAAV